MSEPQRRDEPNSSGVRAGYVPAARAALAGAAVVIVAAIVGASTRRSDDAAFLPPVAPLPRSVFLALMCGAVAAMLVLAAAVIWFLRPEEMPDGAPQDDRRRVVRILLASVVPLLLIMVPLLLLRGLGNEPGLGPQPGGVGIAEPARPAARPPGIDDVLLPAAAFLGMLIAASLVAWRFLRHPPEPVLSDAPPALAPHAAVVEALGDGLDALLGEREPRRAVTVAYARMERAMAVRGWPRHPSEGPTEYVARVLALVPERGGEIAALTELYVLARFSPEVITPSMRDRAIALVERLRSSAEEAGRGG